MRFHMDPKDELSAHYRVPASSRGAAFKLVVYHWLPPVEERPKPYAEVEEYTTIRFPAARAPIGAASSVREYHWVPPVLLFPKPYAVVAV